MWQSLILDSSAKVILTLLAANFYRDNTQFWLGYWENIDSKKSYVNSSSDIWWNEWIYVANDIFLLIHSSDSKVKKDVAFLDLLHK